MHAHQTLYLFFATKKIWHVTTSVATIRFVGSNIKYIMTVYSGSQTLWMLGQICDLISVRGLDSSVH